MNKKVIVAVCALLCTLTAQAADPTFDVQIDGIYYKLNSQNQTAAVAKGDELYVGDVVVPQSFEYEGIEFTVTSVARTAFFQSKELTSVVLPSTVTSVGPSAFMYCYKLSSVVLPDGLTTLESRTFWDCSALSSVNIPSNLRSIDIYAFYNCKKLPSQELPDGIATIGEFAFSDCTSMTSVKLPKNLASLGKLAFSGCTKLTSIVIPKVTVWMGLNPFFNCAIINSIVVEEGNPVYDSRNNCNAIIHTATNELIAGSLSTVIPNDVVSIADCAFEQLRITELVIPEGVVSIGREAFRDCWYLRSIEIPSTCTTIGHGAFNDCSRLNSLTLPEGVERIEDWSISLCSGLNEFHIPNTVTYIGEYAFQNLNRLTSINIPDGVTEIGQSAFSGCSGLTSITLPAGLTSIGDAAFSRCNSIKTIYANMNEPCELGTNVFSSVSSDCVLYVPKGTLAAYEAAGWTTLFGGGVVEMQWERCDVPEIAFVDGEVRVSCATEGSECEVHIEYANSNISCTGNNLKLIPSTQFTITATAHAEGYEDSETVTATYDMVGASTGDLNGDGIVNISDVIKLVNIILNK